MMNIVTSTLTLIQTLIKSIFDNHKSRIMKSDDDYNPTFNQCMIVYSQFHNSNLLIKLNCDSQMSLYTFSSPNNYTT